MARQKIGVYGGTFDPIHIGHLAVADFVRQVAELDRILWVPNSRQPLKDHGPAASGPERLRMVEAAIAGNPAFAASDIEIRQGGPSYTIATLDALRARCPDAELRFILGVDAANDLINWQEPARILAEYRPIVMSRAGWAGPDWSLLESIHKDARSLITLVDAPQLEVASSVLRDWIAAGWAARYLVPEGAWRIIAEDGLYRKKHDRPALDAYRGHR
ncbi:MAG: nicotinate-nucleotide adenylyltransferase [Chloroflexota bacterium]